MEPSPIIMIGGQLDDPPEWAAPIIYAAGMATMHWGRLEQNLDTLLISVNKEAFGPDSYMPTPNTSFRLKLKLFRQWFVKDERFAEHHDLARVLVRSLKKLADDRVLLTHSNVQEFIEGPPAKVVIINVHIKGDDVVQSRGEWTADQIMRTVDGMKRINTGLRMIGEKVLTTDFLRSLEGS